MTAVDAAGNVSPPSGAAPATTPADTTPPSVPGGLTATATSPSQVSLAWTASTDNVAVTGYDVLRDGTVLTTVGSTRYINTGLTAGHHLQLHRPGPRRGGQPLGPVDARPGDDARARHDCADRRHRARRPPGRRSSATVSVGANAADNVGVVGVQFLLDGAPLNAEDTTAPVRDLLGHDRDRQREPPAQRPCS